MIKTTSFPFKTSDATSVNSQPNAIICAANRNPKTNQIIKGFRHFDWHMRHKFDHYNVNGSEFTEQGFIDMYGNFVIRKNALKIVQENGQYFNSKENQSSTELFSEGLYE